MPMEEWCDLLYSNPASPGAGPKPQWPGDKKASDDFHDNERILKEMRNTIRRIERLEQTYCLDVAQVPPQLIRVQYVAPNGEVTDSHVVEIPQPGARTQRGGSRSYRTAASRS